jgi:CHAD domain-containing protein
MAPARDVPVSPQEPFGEAAARVVAARAEELLEHLPRAREGRDIEGVHDLRVAARRLRAALEVFEVVFPAKPHRRLLREVKALADSVGDARDLDVQVDFLRGYLDHAAADDEPGIGALVQRLRSEREVAYAGSGPALDRVAAGGLSGLVDRLVGR